MSKRIVRIAGHQLRPAIKTLVDTMVSVVLNNGNTYFGRIDSLQEQSFTLTDQRAHQHHFSDKDLYEILYDKPEVP